MAPETSIRHGAWYFARLIEKFKGQEPLAIASYNGGPHNVQMWLKHKAHIPLDEFVEEIPFNQARRYTKRVLRYLGLFLHLYEGSEGLYLGQNLSGDILVEPRY
ncbi:MAG: transglycosylase SLT domain-containing protein, partial [bacterium]